MPAAHPRRPIPAGPTPPRHEIPPTVPRKELRP
ncbi:hypothetical protein SALB_02522 [Streptomyces noursei]|uniref:Uncharacterized protein n=1 Tax=Streptomyces noursei TaxID=1971 RepID=A0A401QWU1_STRNR|nr:hypothetical protein SALB_02522 [Streptomyces noursei]